MYREKHEKLNICIQNVIDFDDNCEIYGNISLGVRSDKFSSHDDRGLTRSQGPNADAITDLVIKRMNHVFGPVQRPLEIRLEVKVLTLMQ